MSDETIIPRAIAAAPTAPLRPRLLDRAARRAVHGRLGDLAAGDLTLIDAGGRQRFGAAPDPALRATVRVRDERFYRAVALGGSLGAAETYLRGWWTCDDLVSLLRLFLRNMAVLDDLEGGLARVTVAAARLMHRLRSNTRDGSRRNIVAHYDLGNELFSLFLDDTMTYSCGVFPRSGATLREASIEKLDGMCRALGLRPEHHLLEIGTGWGSLALHAARHYGCRVTTTTISREQNDLARQRIEAAGLSDRVTLLLQDYRDLRGTFDRIVSIEMIEAVGHAYLDTYFGCCSRLLAADGLMALQAITMPDQRYAQYLKAADFIQRHVFPGSCLPSMGAMTSSIGRATDMRLTRVEDITSHYVQTLRHWRRRFEAALPEVRRLGYPDEFVRLWRFYLSYCEAGFAECAIGTSQILMAKPAFGRAAD